jgi:hypothetical protein
LLRPRTEGEALSEWTDYAKSDADQLEYAKDEIRSLRALLNAIEREHDRLCALLIEAGNHLRARDNCACRTCEILSDLQARIQEALK